MEIFVSKRFWAAVVALLVVILNEFGLNVDQETLNNFVMVVVGWIVGDSLRHRPAKKLEKSGV